MSDSKTYSKIPTIIVEDHHEVVPHIHRAIGSKHLPFNDGILIHLDSHPDLLIPIDMKADDVFNKYILYETLSIENWILPLVYAGHISDIYWLKPPWCQQIEEKQIEFFVGKSLKSGTIRTTCKENYFVSETLYVPEHLLSEKKKVTLTVLQVIPENWLSAVERMEQRCKPSRVVSPDAQPCSVSGETVLGETDAVDYTEDQLKECENNSEHETNVSDIVPRSETKIYVTNQCGGTNESGESFQKKRRIVNESCFDCEKERIISVHKEEFQNSSDFYRIQMKRLKEKLENKHYILDVDLDFYSTKNPFRELYTEKQMSLLKLLYKYDSPQSDTDEAVLECVQKRHEQLSKLKSAILRVSKDPDVEIENFDKTSLLPLRELVEDLRSSRQPIDFELVHEAGCTMDDTELPHHISSDGQICQLIEQTRQIFAFLAWPTLITVSRSSVDDYCPPYQVDYIEESLMLTLEEVFVYVDIQRHYENEDEEEDIGDEEGPSTSKG